MSTGQNYKVAVIGLNMGHAWARAACDLPNTELVLAYDKYYSENKELEKAFYEEKNIRLAVSEEEVYQSDADIIVVATPDHFHTEQSIKAMAAGKHVACEKPLAPTVAECRKIIAAVKEYDRFFMTGQVGRYAPGFRAAKLLLESGRIGELVYIESEYAHDYSLCPGFHNWRSDPAIKRQGFLGGGCHALDLVRWMAGDPLEVFAYMNHKHLPDWPAPDTGVAVAKFPNDVIGRVFASIGVKRPYTMRTVLNGTKGTIICDNTSPYIEICEEPVYTASKSLEFSRIPVMIANHNVRHELEDFVSYIDKNEQCPTDVYQGTRTVAFAEAAINSAATGMPISCVCEF
ncbi:MAG: Gfo/Idh/MocA family oxidoreductase [bacterium]|nr:Gfo/Idh/MocA family oxidoreductase [bacterium]